MSIKISINDKLTLINNLGTLIGAGVPILEAISVSAKYSKGGTKAILNQMEEDLKQGKSIHDSFAKFPKTFSPVTINLIKAAEESGNLDNALVDIEQNLKSQKEFNSKIKAALTYPTLVFAVFALILLVILTYVVPKVSDVFSKLKVDIPVPTQILIKSSDILVNSYVYVLLGLLISVGITMLMIKYRKDLLITILTSLPLVSKLAQYIDLARLTHSMNVLLKSGIPITHALDLTANIVARRDIRKALNSARDAVSGGDSLSNSLKDSKVIPELMILIIEAGEKSGTLDKSMKELAERYERDTEELLRTITTLMEPILLVLIGGMVGGIMLAIIAPIYNLIGNISATAGR